MTSKEQALTTGDVYEVSVVYVLPTGLRRVIFYFPVKKGTNTHEALELATVRYLDSSTCHQFGGIFCNQASIEYLTLI